MRRNGSHARTTTSRTCRRILRRHRPFTYGSFWIWCTLRGGCPSQTDPVRCGCCWVGVGWDRGRRVGGSHGKRNPEDRGNRPGGGGRERERGVEAGRGNRGMEPHSHIRLVSFRFIRSNRDPRMEGWIMGSVVTVPLAFTTLKPSKRDTIQKNRDTPPSTPPSHDREPKEKDHESTRELGG